MPNWCSNNMVLTHKDPAMISKAHDAFKEGKLLDTFIPCPRALRETEALHYPRETTDEYIKVMDERQAAIHAINIKHYRFRDWYDWCVGNWGTKWDVGGQDGFGELDDDNTLRLSFVSAWSPPTAAYDKLIELGFEVTAYYSEEGMGFCGYYENGIDKTYNIPESSDEVRKQIPEHIDDNLGISARMIEFEGEKNDDNS